jgi:hypothetical protein
VSEIDPGFMRDIEIALYTMWDYARNEPVSSPVMQIVKNGDLERADAILDRISEWFDNQL